LKKNEINKNELFAHVPVPKALAAMAVPTIISQMVNLIYNMVDGFFIGRTGNSYMMAATSLILTLTMLHVALANLFGVGGGSLVARLMGVGKEGKARRVSALCVYGEAAAARRSRWRCWRTCSGSRRGRAPHAQRPYKAKKERLPMEAFFLLMIRLGQQTCSALYYTP